MTLFTKGTELTSFGELKVPTKFSINLNLKVLRLLNCLYMIFSILYTTLPHNLIKIKLIDLINRQFIRENILHLACNEECAFSSLLMYTRNTIYGFVKTSVMPLFIF